MAQKPRILIVTPEVSYLPEDMGNRSNYSAKAGGLADVSAALISALFDLGCDVHVALPDYRSIFDGATTKTHSRELAKIRKRLDEERIHLAADRAFYYLNNVYSGYSDMDLKVSLAFQREVINNIMPRVEPDIIHCNDWMTGLIPAMSRKLEIPCLFTIHNIHTMTSTMAEIEDRGIDAASFWQWLYFQTDAPENYEESRDHNRVDFLSSGVFAAHYVNTVSPTFIKEIVQDRHPFVEPCLKNELTNKYHAGCATGILNAPEPEFNPAVDELIRYNYGPKNHKPVQGGQQDLSSENPGPGGKRDTPRCSSGRPGWTRCRKDVNCWADIMYQVVDRYWDQGLQIVSVASGAYEKHFHEIVRHHGIGPAGEHLRVQRRPVPPGVCRRGFHPHALGVRALRPAPDDRKYLWGSAHCRFRYRRSA